MKKSHELVEELYKLSKENPDAKINIFVNNDIFNSDDYGASVGTLKSVQLSDVWTPCDCSFVDDEIEEELRQSFEMEPEAEYMSGEDIDAVVEKEYATKVASGEIKKEIIVWVYPY